MSNSADNRSIDFDAHLRTHYQAALSHVTLGTRLRLRPSRANAHAPLLPERLRWAAIGLAVLAVAAFWRLQPPTDDATLAITPVSTGAAVLLEEDPAFLAWLGGSENDWIASQ